LVLGLLTFNMFKGLLSSPRTQRGSGTYPVSYSKGSRGKVAGA